MKTACKAFSVVFVAILSLSTVSAFSATPSEVTRSPVQEDVHWMDFLKFGGSTPSFDVLEKTMEYAAMKELPPSLYADDYVFRGPIIGPITNKDVQDTQKGFNIQNAYPDLDRGCFGFTIDPQNPYRCIFFERWTGTHSAELDAGLFKLPATGNKVELPIHTTSVVWNPEGKIIYQSISNPIDRFEGTTKGAGAIFGLIAGAGADLPTPSVGSPLLMLQQKIVQALGVAGKQWSDEQDIPAWWKSKARGADPNDL